MLNETTTPIRIIVPDRPIGDGERAPELRLTLLKTGEVTLEATEVLDPNGYQNHELMRRAICIWTSHLKPGDVVLADQVAIEDLATLFQPLIDRVRAGCSHDQPERLLSEWDTDAGLAFHSMNEEVWLIFQEQWVRKKLACADGSA